ncbi:uncharacterized protein B0H64DRAFT_402961 [Chaetomium fimeti]|jgi:NAD(P)-dependent dehydrogenase (short-subunit alcohol dehydrogenase family)|uniref:Uncharacterized protein n=1 Tax=Chaetomium fimeti TaxID=1854472 RepID=A0AAE0HAG9_9PEZI|nr:hypothetical protein B0H64DRAFT_402961 [Chaetomium fimeti]
MSGLIALLFTKLSLPPASAIRGETILITGANTGLGREAARHAARLGVGTIIMGVRSLPKGEEAKADIESSTGCSGKTQILVWPLDLESFASVRAFAARARKHVVDDGGRLTMAIMNAGIASMQFALSDEGWEKSLQVNVLSTALLSLHLMPLLLRTGERHPSSRPHLALVSSDNHMSIKFPERHADRILQTMNGEEQWKKSQAAGGPTERYGATKLMDLFLAQEMANRTPRDSRGEPLVVVNAVAPGFCKSDLLTREKTPWILKVVQAAIARSSEEGSKTLLHAVTQGTEAHGKYLDHQAITATGKIASDTEALALREKIWGEIIAVLKGVDPTVPTEF